MTKKIFFECKTKEEAEAAAEGIANYKMKKKCGCDYSVGYTCNFCKKFNLDDEGERHYRFKYRYEWLIYRKRAKMIVAGEDTCSRGFEYKELR